MKTILLAISIIILPIALYGQKMEQIQKVIDSLKKEKDLFAAFSQLRLKEFDRKIDSLNIATLEAKQKEIKELIISVNNIIGKGVKVTLKKPIFLTSQPVLVTSGTIIHAKETITLVRRSDVNCFFEFTYKKYRGYTPVTDFSLPEQLRTMEYRLAFLMEINYTPVPVVKVVNTTSSPSPSKPQSYSTSSPSTYSTYKSTDCGSRQCSGTTKKGARCRNTTTSCSGRCYLH